MEYRTRVEEVLAEQERTISWLARKAGIHPTYAWKMLRGQRPITVAFKAAASEALGVPEADLFPNHHEPRAVA